MLNFFKKALKEELVEIIEWLDNTPQTIVWKFPSPQNNIKNGAKLVIRESQMAILVYDGQFADSYFAGTHTLETANMPILSQLEGWQYGFKNPFKVDVYFINLRPFTNLSWKTDKPFIVKDAELERVRLKAEGKFAMRISDAYHFLREVNGTKDQMTVNDMVAQLQTAIATKFIDTLAESQISISDLAANYLEIGERLLPLLKNDFAEQGLEITKFYIENITPPPKVEAFLDKKAQMNIVKDEMPTFTQFQTAEALDKGTVHTHIVTSVAPPQYDPPKQEVDVMVFKESMALLAEFKIIVDAPYLQVTIPILKSELANEFVRATIDFYVQMTKSLKKSYETGNFNDWSNDPAYQKAHGEYIQLAQSCAHMDCEESTKYTDFQQRINERYAECIQKKALTYSNELQKQQAETDHSTQRESVIKALKDIGDLKQAGILTEAEFEQQKTALLVKLNDL